MGSVIVSIGKKPPPEAATPSPSERMKGTVIDLPPPKFLETPPEPAPKPAPLSGDRPHAVLGGSGAHRWVQCSGSITFPPSPPGPAATEGTKAHEIAEQMLRDHLDHKLTGDIHMRVWDGDPDMIEHARSYVDVVWKEVLEEVITGKAYGLEEKFSISPDLDMSGYVDFWCIYIDDRGRRTGVVVDYKYGFTHVPIERNPQLAFYSVGLREEVRKRGKDLDRVRGIIFQPRLVGKDPYSETSFTGKQLDSWKSKFLKAGKSIFVDEKVKFKVGDWCKFCPGVGGGCKLYATTLDSKTSIALTTPDVTTLPKPAVISDEVRGKILTYGDDIIEFIKAVKADSTQRAISGTPIPGWKPVHGPTRRKWQEDESTISKVLGSHGLSDIYNQKLKGITEIEKVLAKEHSKKGAEAILAGLTEQSAPSTILVEESDPRPSIRTMLDMLGGPS